MPKIEPHRHDAIIVGSSLGGLAAGAMLANKGYSVAVVDTLASPGGRMGTTRQNGYEICWGQRDGLGSSGVRGWSAIVTDSFTDTVSSEPAWRRSTEPSSPSRSE